MAQEINYALKINNLLSEMPDFVTDFIYNFGHTENYMTKFEYCRDIRDFFTYMVNYIPELSDKEIKALTLTDLDNISAIDVNRYLTLLAGNKQKGLSEATVKRRRAALSSMYSFFLSNGKLSKNVVAATRTIKPKKKPLIYLTDEEQATLLNAVRTGQGLPPRTLDKHDAYVERDSALFLLLLDTGLRVSEMVATNIIDYDLNEGSVLVTRKGGDIEFVYFSDECASFLFDYFASQRTKYALSDAQLPAFTTLSGERLGVRAVEVLVKKYVSVCLPEKAKLISPHKLRSSFAMSFYEASDNNILLLKEKLHHKSISTTTIYAEASKKEIIATRNLLQGKRNK